MITGMGDRQETFRRIADVWQGEADLSTLDELVTRSYIGHIGSRDRDLSQLKHDIAAYRQAAPDVRFRVEHQFGEGEYVATRVTAHASNPRPESRQRRTAAGKTAYSPKNGLSGRAWRIHDSGQRVLWPAYRLRSSVPSMPPAGIEPAHAV
jgi:hypothetical protein